MLQRITAWCLLFLGILCQPAYKASAQYFSKLYDYNNSIDIPANVFIRPDGSYLTIGQSIYNPWVRYSLVSAGFSANGDSILFQRTLFSDTINFYEGEAGTAVRYGNQYLTIYSDDKFRSGTMLLDSDGKLDELKTYNDTTTQHDIPYWLSVCQDSSILIAGEAGTVPISYTTSGLLVKLKRDGSLDWRRNYIVDSGRENAFTSVEELPNHHILVYRASFSFVRIAGICR